MASLRPEIGNQENTKQDPNDDLGQSKYDFRYLVFPNDLGMEDNGHYMVININVPTKTLSNAPAGNYTNQFTLLGENERSKVDKLRYGANGSLTPFFDVNLRGSPDRFVVSLPRRTRRIAESVVLHMPSPLVYNTHNSYEEISLTALAEIGRAHV